MKIIITCEHGGNLIPIEYNYLFKDVENILTSHMGWDIGALKLARVFAKKFSDYFFFATTSRLLIDLNRSLNHPKLYSTFTRDLNRGEKKQVLENYYYPYRNKILQTITKEIDHDETVLHISVHSFTPIFNGQKRKVDIGLLYDPQRQCEKEMSHFWKARMKAMNKEYHIRFNSPYLGISDGLVSSLRKKFSSHSYIGIELEVNQCLFANISQYNVIKNLLIKSFSEVLMSFSLTDC